MVTEDVRVHTGTELLGPQGRQVFSTGGVCVFFALGYLMLPLLAFLLRDWRHLLAGLSVPSFLMLPLWWWVCVWRWDGSGGLFHQIMVSFSI